MVAWLTVVLLGWEWADDEVAVVEIGGWLVGEPGPGEQGDLSGGTWIDLAQDVHGEHEHRPGVVRDAHRCGAQRRHEHNAVSSSGCGGAECVLGSLGSRAVLGAAAAGWWGGMASDSVVMAVPFRSG